MTVVNTSNQQIWDSLLKLKKDSDESREIAFQKRLATRPYITDLEYLLGAFLEMYEPHLIGIVRKLFKKGYALDVTSGFCGKYAQYQAINGSFSFDYVTKNRLEKAGVTQREFGGLKSLVFWPMQANINHIKKRLLQMIELLPDKGVLTVPANNYAASEFRRKYVPKNLKLRQTMQFERLQHRIQSEVHTAVKKRIEKNPTPTEIENSLGVFMEALEPQVRQAVLTLHKKGYSVDVSGFTNNPCEQAIEGDFQLNENTVQTLFAEGVIVETTGSGYTKLQFTPDEADMNTIQNRWKTIVGVIPDTHNIATDSMTRRARDFRSVYSE